MLTPFLDEIHTLQKALGHELSVLAEKQMQLVCWSATPWENFPILLRGGICVGDISMDPDPRSDEIVFGPAMALVQKLTLVGVKTKPREFVNDLSFLTHTCFYKSFRNLFLERLTGGWFTRCRHKLEIREIRSRGDGPRNLQR
ncbi:MAG TPA: hypothetical protein VGH51_16815 [Candidatus Angelobacter sp.]|jgi:hypothetical protein